MNIEIIRRLVCNSCLPGLGLGARGFPVCTPGREHLEYFCQWEGCLGVRDSGISPVWNPHEQFHSDCTLSHVTDIHPCKHNVLRNSVAHPGVSPSRRYLPGCTLMIMPNGSWDLPARLRRKGSRFQLLQNMWQKKLDEIQKVEESRKEWKDFRNTTGIMTTSFHDATTTPIYLTRWFIR